MGAAVGGGHVVGGVHGLGDMLLMMVMMSMVVAMGRWVVLGPASAARGGPGGGGAAHVGAGLHLLLPSRQMPAVVHHAGLGCGVWWLMR